MKWIDRSRRLAVAMPILNVIVLEGSARTQMENDTVQKRAVADGWFIKKKVYDCFNILSIL